MLDIDTPIQFVKGVGPAKADALAKAGIRTVYDLLLYLPFRYEDRSRRLQIRDVQPGQEATVEVEVVAVRVKSTRRKNFKIVEVVAKDETGQLKAVWFNQEYLKDTLKPGRRVLIFGKFERAGFTLFPEVKNPQYELVEPGQDDTTHAGRIVPVYGRIDMVVGTHALIQEGVRFRELGLAIIDEQHRFGVLQLAELSEKGFGCDLLFMTATPIPRTLALTLHGDLQSSILDELPPGRKPIVTERLDDSDLKRVFHLMEREIEKGHQVYFVCPLVEESEKMDLKAAVARYESLAQGPFRSRRVALVHGKMAAGEREAAMDLFAPGKGEVLVATTVVEG